MIVLGKVFNQYIISFILLLLLNFNLLRAQGRYGEQLPENSITSSLSNKGYLYSGIDNLIRIDYSIISECDTFFLMAPGSIIIHDTIDKFLIIPERPGTIRLSVYCLKGKDTMALGYRYFTVNNIPDPSIKINGHILITPALISKNLLLSGDSISIYFSDDLIGSENWFRITDFSIGYNYGGFHVSHLNPSNKISMQTKNLISRLGPDHEISIQFTVESEGKIKKQLPIYRIQFY
jgi:hypothetical protein